MADDHYHRVFVILELHVVDDADGEIRGENFHKYVLRVLADRLRRGITIHDQGPLGILKSEVRVIL